MFTEAEQEEDLGRKFGYVILGLEKKAGEQEEVRRPRIAGSAGGVRCVRG